MNTPLGPALAPASFWIPDYFCSSAWIEHAPFAFWLVDTLRPRTVVELGTHWGYSYFVFCQAIDRLGLGAAAYAVDTWKGDEHTGFYDESVFSAVATRNAHYAGFSTLMRTTFDEAVGYFPERSIDLLHIDGQHYGTDVQHDFETWLPRLSEHAVVLLHDTNVREREFGVWRFFADVAGLYPSFQFLHGHGLGMLAPGTPPQALAALWQGPKDGDMIRIAYAALGSALSVRAALAAHTEENRQKPTAALPTARLAKVVGSALPKQRIALAFGGHGTHADYEDE